MGQPLDRRSVERWHFQVPAKVRLVLDSENSTSVEDISDRGLMINVNPDIPIGSVLNLKIEYPNEPEMKLEARIIWKQRTAETDEYRVGLFILNRGDHERLQKIILNSNKVPKAGRRISDRRRISASVLGYDYNRRDHDRRHSASLKKRITTDANSLDRWASFYTYERVIQSGSGPIVTSGYRSKIMLGSNNYLGLTEHPKVKEAAIRAVEKYGTGAGGVRVLSGTLDLHRRLEEKLAQFKGAEACLVFSSGYVSNVAILTSIIKKDDVVFNDELNHASIIDGCRATRGILRFYKHSNMENLERKLRMYGYERSKLIITDGVFSMDGDIAKLGEISSLAKKYNATILVDDAHATGVIGTNGQGTAEFCGMFGKTDITNVTLSKALGGIGGAVCGSRALIKYITHSSRQFIFSSALPPSVCASTMAAIDVITAHPELIQNLHINKNFLVDGLRKIGYKVPATQTAIVPIIIGDEVKTYKLAALLDNMNVFVNAVSRPAVPRELSRLRASVMATHNHDQLEEALFAFKKAGQALGLV